MPLEWHKGCSERRGGGLLLVIFVLILKFKSKLDYTERNSPNHI